MSYVVDSDDEVLRLKAAVVETYAANEVLQARLAHATWHVTTLRGSLEAAQARLIEYREALEDSQAQLSESRLESERVHADLQRVHEEQTTSATALAAVLASPSWRVTAPLRAAKKLVGRGRATPRD